MDIGEKCLDTVGKKMSIKDILFEDLVLCGFTHENAPPHKDCLEECDVLNDREGMPLGEHGRKKHKRCMVCWEEYVDSLVERINEH